MIDKVYLVVTRKWNANTSDKQETCTVSNEVFEKLGDARQEVMQDEDFVGIHQGWIEDKEGNETVERRFERKALTGESCEWIARWEIRLLPIRPSSQ